MEDLVVEVVIKMVQDLKVVEQLVKETLEELVWVIAHHILLVVEVAQVAQDLPEDHPVVELEEVVLI
jgi:hypothetical protein|tara:strand:- start:322 stop:522 length:201 start_codon:yes stop_codon:yes gene_type:complete